jgi:hypothetical protein
MCLIIGCDQPRSDMNPGDGGDSGTRDDAGGTDLAARPKRVFITSLTYSGDLKSAGAADTGLAGGDKICQHLADAATIGGSWKAWLSDATTDAIDRIDEGPWYLVTYATSGGGGPATETYELKAFNNKANLSTTPINAINITETGQKVTSSTGYIYAWTGTKSAGTKAAQTCTNWTSNAMSDHGLQGEVASAVGYWTDNPDGDPQAGSPLPAFPCDSPEHLYCFEQ